MKPKKQSKVNIQPEVFVVDRREQPIYIDWELDGLNLCSESFRVYCHLVRQVSNGYAYLDYESIGKACFRRSCFEVIDLSMQVIFASFAVQELIKFGLIEVHETWIEYEKQKRKMYMLTPKEKWAGGLYSSPPALEDKQSIVGEVQHEA